MPVLGEVALHKNAPSNVTFPAPLKTVGTSKGVSRTVRKSQAAGRKCQAAKENRVVGQKRRVAEEDVGAGQKKRKTVASEPTNRIVTRQQFDRMTRASSNAIRMASARSAQSENEASTANMITVRQAIQRLNMDHLWPQSDDEHVALKHQEAHKPSCSVGNDPTALPARPSSSLSSLSGESAPSLVSSSSSSPSEDCAPCDSEPTSSSAALSIPAKPLPKIHVAFTEESQAASNSVRDQAYDAKVTSGQLDNVDDVLAYLWENERRWCVDSSYMSRQTGIDSGMRAVLIDWIVDVHAEFALSNETLYLTVALIDNFLSMHQIEKSKLQLVGVTCMWLASKYEEIDPPKVTEFSDICDNAYKFKMIVDMEKLLLNALNWELSFPSPYDFLRCWSVVRVGPNKAAFEAAKFLTEVALQDFAFLKYSPSVLASAALHLAVERCGDEQTRQSTAFLLDMHAPGTVEACSRHLRKAASALLARTDLSAIRNKYASAAHMEVANRFQ